MANTSVKAATVFVMISLIATCWFVPFTKGISSSSINIFTSGTIIQPRLLTEKTVNWSDGSEETITVDDSGTIFLNGQKTVAFGLNIVTIAYQTEDVTAPKVLDTLQAGGVRFMALDISGWLNVNQGVGWIDFWMPKLYEHKMWVALYIQQSPNNPPDLNVSEQAARFLGIIQGITNQTYANMIFTVGYNWELDLSRWNFTDGQVSSYLSQLYPLIKDEVKSSLVGSVPVVGKNSASTSTFGTRPIVQYSDIPTWDFYYDLSDANGWQHSYDVRASAYLQTMANAGKNASRIWYGDTGANANGEGANELYSPEMLSYLLNQSRTGAMFLWVLQWDSPDYKYKAFDMNGNINPWFENILAYYSGS